MFALVYTDAIGYNAHVEYFGNELSFSPSCKEAFAKSRLAPPEHIRFSDDHTPVPIELSLGWVGVTCLDSVVGVSLLVSLICVAACVGVQCCGVAEDARGGEARRRGASVDELLWLDGQGSQACHHSILCQESFVDSQNYSQVVWNQKLCM